MSREEIVLDEEQQTVYDAAFSILQNDDNGVFRAPIPSLVCLDANNIGNNDSEVNSDDPVTLVTPTKGHHALSRAVEELEGLEKEEQALKERSPVAQLLTEIITQQSYLNSKEAIESLHEAGKVVPRRVCQHPFRKNDIVWVCRTCQADETCVLCHGCYSQSNHEGHDVAFYHAQAGGCCDCGDPDAWDPAGFCPRHGPNVQASASEVNAVLPQGLVHRVRGAVPAAIDWMVQVVAKNAELAHERVHFRPKKKTPTPPQDATISKSSQDGTISSVSGGTSSVELMDIDMDNDSEFSDESDDEGQPVSTSLVAAASPPGRGLQLPRPFVFSPEAASSAAAHRANKKARFQEERANELGLLGSSGHGWYIVLHADDIRSSNQIADAVREFLGTSNYYTDSLLTRVIRALRQYGQLVIWGNLETLCLVGPTQYHLWMDHDKVASARVGALMIEKSCHLIKHGLYCGLVTRDELLLEQRAVALLQWLSEVARSCDPLCQTVAECILPNRHLVPLLRADFKMSARVTKAWYSLLLTLLAVPTFKSHLAAAYCDTYRYVTSKYARGMGVLERSGYTLSVQFLNRVTYVVDLVRRRDLLGKLGKSLLETMLVACRSKNLNSRIDPNHFVLTHRRYSPCISDLKCVLNVKGMPRLFAAKGGTFLWDWIDTLSISQQMDPQHWRTWFQGHVEDESRGWVGAFNASISLGSLFERLLGWDDDEKSPINDKSSPLSKELMSCSELSYHILVDGVFVWQTKEMLLYQPNSTPGTEPYKMAPASLPFSTVTASRGTAVAMQQMPVSQNTSFSFHLPLHRFVAGCLRELCLRTDDRASGIYSLFNRLKAGLSETDYNLLFLGLMEFPLLTISRASQVRAGLWRRNGAGLSDQVLNYSEPPFCRTMRDADLLLVQFAVFGRTRHQSSNPDPSDVGVSFFVNLLLHRLGVFDFCGFKRAPDEEIPRYIDEIERGIFPTEPKATEATSNDLILPSSYSPATDQGSFLLLIEDFLYCMVIFISELPQVVPRDREEQTEQARKRLFREVVHRLASGPKTHSELLEVHHVMSHWDNLLLSEEGKLINPDDATGAALGKVLDEVADRKSSRGKLEPDKWIIKPDAWTVYDPSFHHISLRMHQTAAENRPKPEIIKNSPWGRKAQPYAPEPPEPHPFFKRLRRDATTDATTLVVVYRTLHMHLRGNTSRDTSNLPGRLAYDKEKSETALARAVHLLTLGIYAWSDAKRDDDNWRSHGGGSPGSIFYRWERDVAPVMSDWVEEVLLSDPATLTGIEWYKGEEKMLLLLRRLASNDAEPGDFSAQDLCMKTGAAWICEFAASHSFEAKDLVNPKPKDFETTNKKVSMAERQRRSREKALAMMRAAQSNFADMNADDLREKEEQVDSNSVITSSSTAISTSSTPLRPIRATSFGSTYSAASSVQTGSSEGGLPSMLILEDDSEQSAVPPRLLKDRPQCIICSELEVEPGVIQRTDTENGEGMRKRSKKRAENALGFVGYIQASTVLKGGGGPPPDLGSSSSPVREFVGTHVALCGHAVHSECCESYLATVSQREDRGIGKRDEFRCPLCQRLSNCLVPFIDVGSDWIEPPSYCRPCSANQLADTPDNETDSEKMQVDTPDICGTPSLSIDQYLATTPWWVMKNNSSVVWDGQSGFVTKSSISAEETPETSMMKPSSISALETPETPTTKLNRRRVRRPLTKKDLYAAWNSMMRTPRFVRRKFRSRNIMNESSQSTGHDEFGAHGLAEPEESSGETVVWRRFMDQISELSYRADSKRLGDEHLHDLFGEFRHYVVEKYAYNMANRFERGEPTEWPYCVFNKTLSDQRRQEMSREKILSKLFLAVQAFTYSCACEAFEAKRTFRKSAETASLKSESGCEAVLSKFGMAGVTCGGGLIVMPPPFQEKDNGLQPFDGRLGKLRYLGLALVAASGAVSADLVQLALAFPTAGESFEARQADGEEKSFRAPIAYPLLLGNVLTHVVAAMCATCGRGRALSDSLDLSWSPVSGNRNFVSSHDLATRKSVDSVVEDCEGFMKLGVLARILQVLLGRIRTPPLGFPCPSAMVAMLQEYVRRLASESTVENSWRTSCGRLLIAAFASQDELDEALSMDVVLPTYESINQACDSALSAACSFLIDSGTIIQILLPSVVWRYDNTLDFPGNCYGQMSSYELFSKLCSHFMIEPVTEMLSSPLTLEIVSNWYKAAVHQGKVADGSGGGLGNSVPTTKSTLCARLYRTQGFREFDWPSPGESEKADFAPSAKDKGSKSDSMAEQPQDGPNAMQIEKLVSGTSTLSTSELVSHRKPPPLVAYRSKKIIPLLGGYTADITRPNSRPRVTGMPVAYTDLYAELGTLMPECEQTAVCLVCGEVLNAGGKGECTRHAFKCGAGAGIFFLLQECSGLILHRSKAAYIHSPYVDSHGETPQHRGRPLNLDLDRYEHLREVWFGHSVRQHVIAERGSSRQVILNDFY